MDSGRRIADWYGEYPVMEIAQEGSVLTLSTMEEKLARNLGKGLYRAHKGELRYQWAYDQKQVRVY